MDKKNLKFAILAVDVVIFSIRYDKLITRLMQVDCAPFYVGASGFPGGLIKPEETAIEAVKRITEDKGKINPNIYFEQLYTFSEVDRDPRGRVVSVVYMACVPWEKLSKNEQKDSNTFWIPVDNARNMAYDHDKVLALAVDRLKAKISYSTLVSKFLPEEFTLSELQKTYELLGGNVLDKRNFRKKLDQLKILKETNQTRSGLPSRPAKLFKFKNKKIMFVDIL